MESLFDQPQETNRKARQAEYQRRWRQERAKTGLCIKCNTPVLSGKKVCQRHLDLQAERRRKIPKAKKLAWAKRWHAANRMAGKCAHCAKQAKPGKTMCAKHLKQASESAKRRFVKIKAKVEQGFCYCCSEPAMPGLRFCETHLKYRRAKSREGNQRRYAERKAAYRKFRAEQKRELGVCQLCELPVTPGFLHCDFHLEQDRSRRQKQAEEGRERLQNGLCSLCDQPLDPSSAIFCATHKLKEQRRKQKKNVRRVRKLVAQGLCVRCRKPLPPGPKRSCDECLVQFADYMSKKRAENIRQGLCVYCGRLPSLDGCNRCADCYFKKTSVDHFGTIKFWQNLRELFEKTDGVCKYTGQRMLLGQNANLDHIIALTRNGPNTIENVQWISFDANQMKRNRTHDEFISICKLIASRH